MINDVVNIPGTQYSA